MTAYPDYALRAFDVRALDYLLKPFAPPRFRRALARAREELARLETDQLVRHVARLGSAGPPSRPASDRLMVKADGRVYLVRTEDLDWVEAAGNYLRLHVGPATHMVRQTMNAIEAQLDPEQFLRIHRSQMVNIDRIRELQPLLNGEYAVVLRSGERLTLSRGYRERVRSRLGDAF